MEFSAADRCYSHASLRPGSITDSQPDSPASETSSHHRAEDDPEKSLTPQASRASQPALARRTTTRGTATSVWTHDPSFEVDWEDGDPKDPRNWPMWYKSLVIFSISYGTLVVVLFSTSYTTGIFQMQEEFNVSSEPIVTLGVTTYLLGVAAGSLILAPISETYGRKPVYAISMFFFVILIIPCALATSMAEIIVVRFFVAVAGSAMIANSPGTVADIINEEYRATAFSIWSLGPMNGPVFGPIIGGLVTQYRGWRWANWVVMIAGGAALVMMILIPETYSPALLQQKARRMRKETGEDEYWSRYDQRLPFIQLMKVNLSRPFHMALTEPILWFWNGFIALIYGILYLCFVAYPIVFMEIRGWSIATSGLAFIGIGIGCVIVIACAPLIRKMINAHKPDANGHIPPEAAMSVVCIAAVCIPVGELWFAWTCVPKTIHWAAPIAAGIPFGAGNTAVFIYASSYLTSAYGIYAASAMAGNSVVRSLIGGTLPLAGPAMYKALGANWAGTLLGILEVLIIPIPFVFYKYGHKIREKSRLIRDMREIEERQERKRRRAEEKLRQATERGDAEAMRKARLTLVKVNTSATSASGIVGIGKARDWDRERSMDKAATN